ncbi:MAG: ribosome biogenesis GTP-binding protein YihA/YsxC [Buchnera aphidicola (Schlechtendalia peitan)]
MCKKNYNNIIFLKSIFNIQKEKYEHGSEIAFIGYSNSGKSSTINILSNQRNLARVSKIPGRTQSINIFQISPGIRLIDLPGYGYAKIPKNIKLDLTNMIFQYLKFQKCLKGLVMLIDIRRSIKFFDKTVMNLAKLYHIPILILLNKADKIVVSEQKKRLNIVRQDKLILSNNINVELFSSFKKIGLDSLKYQLDCWICNSILT